MGDPPTHIRTYMHIYAQHTNTTNFQINKKCISNGEDPIAPVKIHPAPSHQINPYNVISDCQLKITKKSITFKLILKQFIIFIVHKIYVTPFQFRYQFMSITAFWRIIGMFSPFSTKI